MKGNVRLSVKKRTEEPSQPSVPSQTTDEAGAGESQALGVKKAELLELFNQKYGYRLPIELIPGESTFALLVRAHKAKSCEFIPLSRVSSASDTRGELAVEHVRIKGTNGDLLFDPSRSLSRRNNEFSSSSDAFTHALKLLMYGYVLVSCADPDGLAWCSMQAATRHLTAVEAFARVCDRAQPGLRPKLLESEMGIRREWHRIAISEPGLLLSDIIELVSQRHSMWPSVLEIRPFHSKGRDSWRNDWRDKGGKGKGGKYNRDAGRDREMIQKRWHAKLKIICNVRF